MILNKERLVFYIFTVNNDFHKNAWIAECFSKSKFFIQRYLFKQKDFSKYSVVPTELRYK